MAVRSEAPRGTKSGLSARRFFVASALAVLAGVSGLPAPAAASPITIIVDFTLTAGTLLASGSITVDDASPPYGVPNGNAILSTMAPVSFSFSDAFATWDGADIVPGGLGAYRMYFDGSGAPQRFGLQINDTTNPFRKLVITTNNTWSSDAVVAQNIAEAHGTYTLRVASTSTPVPEPATLALLGLGLAGLGFARRCKTA